MNEFSAAVYSPPSPELPTMVGISKNGEIVASKPVASVEDGLLEVARAMKEPPKLA